MHRLSSPAAAKASRVAPITRRTIPDYAGVVNSIDGVKPVCGGLVNRLAPSAGGLDARLEYRCDCG